jgi:hypothetical protein
MASDEVESLLNEVKNVLAPDTGYPLEATFWYVESASEMFDMSIFTDLADISCSAALCTGQRQSP